MEEKSMYEKKGVDSDKGLVKKAFETVNENEIPGAWVNIITDPWNSEWVLSAHGDGSGSRSVTHLIYYFETEDETKLKGDIKSAIIMNTGDLMASGFDSFIIIDIVDINKFNVPKDVYLRNVAIGLLETKTLLRKHGFIISHTLGGETADLPDQDDSVIVNAGVFSRMPRENVIAGNVQPNDVIYGFSSGGRAFWEKEENSGHMDNGSTMSRTCLLHPIYEEKYPFLCSPQNKFGGKYFITDYVPELGMTIGDALLSPTRQWAIVIKMIINKLKERNSFHLLHGISMNTGGGATKIANLGKGIIYEKKMPRPLPLFKLIQYESGETWRNMYKTFNMGVGLDVIGSSEKGILGTVIAEVSKESGVKSFMLGKCRPSRDGNNQVVLETPDDANLKIY